MGRTFRKFDKDDRYHNVKREREQAKNGRAKKHKREIVKEEDENASNHTKRN